MTIGLDKIVHDFAAAFKAVDTTAPQGSSKSRIYQPGIGPLPEADAITRALAHLRQVDPITYGSASPQPYPAKRQACDLVIPGHWALEFKLLRPYGDNGVEAEHWSENVLHPYPGNTSSISDCLKLIQSGFKERKGIIVFGYEHTPPLIDLTIAINAFEVIARQVVGIYLSNRIVAELNGLIHPYHQQGKVFGWELL